MHVALYIDTGSSRPGLAIQRLSDKGIIRYAETAPLPYSGSGEAFFRYIRDMLSSVGAAFSDINAMYAYTGPGGFTGVRIGLSTAAGIRAGGNIPLYGIDGFTRAAYVAPDAPGYAVMIPAGRNMIYAAVLSSDYSLRIKPHMLSTAHIPAFIATAQKEFSELLPVITPAMSGAALELDNAVTVSPGVRDMTAIATASPEIWTAGTDVLPVYVRPPDAKPQPKGFLNIRRTHTG